MNKLAITLLLVLMAGCATVTPNYDTKFGDSVRQANLKMTINPGAGRNSEVAGMDGIAARNSIILYQDTFKTPPPVVNVINIGGGLTSGGGGR